LRNENISANELISGSVSSQTEINNIFSSDSKKENAKEI